uniref:Toll-like receptor 16 n=1 Tax=Littorina littorea TaxID=31216 RepID=A0A7G8ZA12_LITLI|nr:toll-like receptor 16 [Littorina littorea]
MNIVTCGYDERKIFSFPEASFSVFVLEKGCQWLSSRLNEIVLVKFPTSSKTAMEASVLTILLWVTFLSFTTGNVFMRSTSWRVASPRLQATDTSAEAVVTPNQTVTKKVKCFGEKCTCYKSTADCSRNNGSLTYIPKLKYSRNIWTLIFSYNNLTNISRDDFFANLSTIRVLHLQNNGLRDISPGAFRLLTKLQALYLDDNKLTYHSLLPVFLANHLHSLTLRNMQLGRLPQDYFFRQPMPPLSVLDLSENSLTFLNFTAFRPLVYLQQLGVRSCRINRVHYEAMPHLQTLKLGNNALYDFLKSCAVNGTSLFPKLKVIDFSQNGFTRFDVHRGVCLPNLQTLTMSKNNINHFETDMFGEERFPRLMRLNVGSMQNIEAIDEYAFRNPTLEVLGMYDCRIRFCDDSVNATCFAGNPRLQQLQLSHNFLAGLSDDKFSMLFGSVKNLNNLYLGQCEIRSISPRAFAAGLKNLTALYLHRNKLADLPDGTFDSLTKLTTLTLGLNQLRTVREKLFSPALQGRLKLVDLSGNPFVCDCDLLWFKNWFVSSHSKFQQYTNYTCHNLADTGLKNFVVREAVCSFSQESYKAMISCVTVFVFLMFVLAVVYQYRWHIRLKLTFRSNGDTMRRRLRKEDSTYDIFLSCAEEDQPWIRKCLIPFLEEELGLRLCFQDRDADPSKPVITNIEEGVESSRKIMAVFSKHYAQDPVRRFELDVCLSEVVDYDDQLIVTCVGDVTPRDLTSTMMAVMNTTMYIQWQDEPGTRNVFWDRLRLSLRDLRPQCC